MADEGVNSDVLMFFVQTQGSQPIAAESTSALAGNDARLMGGFVAGRYFEVENFSFGMDLEDDEGGGSSGGKSFGRWRSLTPGKTRPDPPFKAEPHDVTISRRIDASSPVLLQYCLDTKRFDQAVVVKRSRIGTTGMLSAVLRLEFSKVWVKSIEWEDGDAVRETCKFKFLSVKATYVKRKPDGTVASLWPCEWSGAAPQKQGR